MNSAIGKLNLKKKNQIFAIHKYLKLSNIVNYVQYCCEQFYITKKEAIKATKKQMMSSQKKLESSIMVYPSTFHCESQLCHVLQSDFLFKKGSFSTLLQSGFTWLHHQKMIL